MTNIIIYHNPACGTSRNALALIRNSGVEPTVILYLETPPSRDELKKRIADMGIRVRDLLRFPELSSRQEQSRVHQLTEYFLVGSFVSWLIALSALALLAS